MFADEHVFITLLISAVFVYQRQSEAANGERNYYTLHMFNGPFVQDYPGGPVPER